MSAIHRNGILRSECYPNQQLTIAVDELRSMDDFLLRNHMIKLAGLKAKNLSEVYKWLKHLHALDEYDEGMFFREFS